jgi:hypothetical protein
MSHAHYGWTIENPGKVAEKVLHFVTQTSMKYSGPELVDLLEALMIFALPQFVPSIPTLGRQIDHKCFFQACQRFLSNLSYYEKYHPDAGDLIQKFEDAVRDLAVFRLALLVADLRSCEFHSERLR